MRTIGEFRELISISVSNLVQIEFKGLFSLDLSGGSTTLYKVCL